MSENSTFWSAYCERSVTGELHDGYPASHLQVDLLPWNTIAAPQDQI